MQRGSIKQHGRNWVLKYRGEVTKNGLRIRKDLYKVLAPIDREHQPRQDGSAPDNVRALADMELAPVNAGLRAAHSVDSVLTFLETFLAKGEGGRGRKLAHTTQGNYKDMFKLVLPYLPNIELRQVRTPHIDRLLRAVAEADGEENRKAHTTYRNLKNFLSSAFRYAVRNGLIDFNPVRDAAIPEGNEADTYAYSLQEVHAIMQALKNAPPVMRAALMVGAFTGLRMEEMKGLRWEDYDTKQGVLNIRRAVVDGRVVELKTKASKAPVPVVRIVQKVLAEHLRKNSGDGFIFHGETGEPLRFENIARRDIIPILKKKNVSWHGFHAFRRGLSTVLHNLDIPELRIKHILRHSISASDVTGKHYIKPSVEKNRKALERVATLYNKISKK